MKDVNRIFETACDILDDCGIEYGTIKNIKINTRAKSRWGMSTQHEDGTFTIEISDRLLADDVEDFGAMNTMVHELLHCHKNHRGHKGEWQRCADIVNSKYPLNIKRCNSSEEKGVAPVESNRARETKKYSITCDTCGTVSYRKRYSRVLQILENPSALEYCTCGRCGGHKFTVERI